MPIKKNVKKKKKKEKGNQQRKNKNFERMIGKEWNGE